MLLSDIAQRMSSYRHPSDTDLLMIRHAVANEEDVIATLDSKINEIMTQLEQLRLRKMNHQEIVQQYRSLMTLARRIPLEVLGSIFELCAESGWTRAPLVLSHVCSTWRKAAEFPRVWSRVYIDCGLGNPLAKTTLWLSRAQQSPLYITLDIPSNTSSLGEILPLFLERSTQWRSVIIKTRDSAQLNHILSLMHHPFPYLHKLGFATDWDTAADLVDLSAVRNAPALHELSIEQPDLPRWSIPFQLTALRLVLSTPRTLPSQVQASRWTNILSNLLSLKHLTLELSSNSDISYWGDTGDTVELPHLESLTFMVSPKLLGFLSKVRAPILRKLFLRRSPGHDGHDRNTAGCVRGFLESSLQIELLELHDIDLSREELARCFALLPQLKELRLHNSDMSDDELKLLHGPTGQCPNLVRLDVRWCVHLTGSALVHLVKSRVQVDVEGGKSQTVLEQASALEEVTAINCLRVKERDVLDIAQFTVCRLKLRTEDDFCRQRGCCTNERYRQRMRLRHNIAFHEGDPVLARIIL
ncbi:hypothetical protein JVU11DRAFT_1770 [Chiua virens]|nr:hypothetical protein JVU11DRAFT_1770 [Chiua virens]